MDRQDEQDMTKTDEVPQRLNIDDATRELYRACKFDYGWTAQCDMLIEECGELITALSHYKRSSVPVEMVIEELVDVQIMVEQFLLILQMVTSRDDLEEYFIRRRKIVLESLSLKLARGEGRKSG